MRRRRSRPITSITGVAALALTLAAGGCGSGAVRTHQPASTSHHQPATHRLHRSVSLVRNATPQADWRPFTAPVPILVYHDLGTPPAGEPYPGLYVPDGEFE